MRFLWSLVGRGPRARRGDVRSGILALLAERPCNGYQLMQEFEQRSQGAWRPSPGAVYPALQQLEDEGLIRVDTSGSGRVFQLTEAGLAYVKEHQEELKAPWDSANREDASDSGHLRLHDMHQQAHEVMGLIHQVASAAMQVVRTGDDSQIAKAQRVLNDTRRSLYRILAEDEPSAD